jgi:cytochrome o ubiquinol oxidase subunit 2
MTGSVRPCLGLRRFACAALLLGLAACSGEVLDPAGDIARQQRDIIYISTALMLLIIVPVIVLIVVFAWRYRKGRGGTYDPNFDHSTSLELAIWSAPLLIIIALSALTWSSTHLLDPFRPLPPDSPSIEQTAAKASVPAPRPMVVQVVSLDWKWLFIYPEQGVATVNELVLPVNRQVRFDITSSNMMNTFYAPTLAGMIYAMPGMQSRLHAVLRRPGEFEGFSANYSGAGFSDMRFRLRGVDDAGFARWVAEAKASGRPLEFATYRELVKPSEKVPVTRFAGADADLYRRILERCVEPGTVCMSEMMKRGGGHGHGMPAHGGTVPHARPEGALFKEGEEKGTGPNITKPAPPEKAPGAAEPGSQKNRSMS